MPMTRQQILDEAKRLSPGDRQAIAEALLDLPDEGDLSSEAWRAEIARRIEEAEANPSSLHDGEAVFVEVRAKLRQLRGEA
jgi:putative addiction module component (TIGR02574 family)